MPDAARVEMFRKQFENYSNEQLIHEMAQWTPFAEQHVAAKQLMYQRDSTRHVESQSLNRKILRWARIGVLVGAIGVLLTGLAMCRTDTTSQKMPRQTETVPQKKVESPAAVTSNNPQPSTQTEASQQQQPAGTDKH